jgi:hypothetical protein
MESGGLLGDGLRDLVGSFKSSGQGEIADSWVVSVILPGGLGIKTNNAPNSGWPPPQSTVLCTRRPGCLVACGASNADSAVARGESKRAAGC